MNATRDSMGDKLPAEVATAALSITGLSKTFGGERALIDVDFEVSSREVHALVGQNGSGKSTLIKILAGYHQPDPGATVNVDGSPLRMGDSQSAFAAGLRFVHQDLGLVPALGALDNLALGRGYRCGRTGSISWRRERKAAKAALGMLGYDFDVSVPVSRLSASERTGVAIARSLDDSAGKVRLLILDEPTATLPAAEVARLFEVIRRVQNEGVPIIYVSHHFNEVFEIADRVTVLRDGRRIGTYQCSDLDEAGLIRLTLGREITAPEMVAVAPAAEKRRDLLRVSGLGGTTLRTLDLTLGEGEVVGVAGVTGSGREEVARLVFGEMERRGQVEIDSTPLPPHRPYESTRLGMALVPSDRLAHAAFARMTVGENITISRLDSFYGAAGRKRKAEQAEARVWLDKLGIVPPDPGASFLSLSGGNQQKVILARALRMNPRILILDEPTQGVDVGAKAAIHEIVRSRAEAGTGVLVISSESDELVALCDKIIVLVAGRIAQVVDASDVSADDVTNLTVQVGAMPGP